MLSKEELDRIVVVLVRARNPSNIGAVARAMHDFGFGHLRVVNEFQMPFEAARSGVDASSVIAAATSHDSVAAAIADCTLVAGTTAVGNRGIVHRLLGLSKAAAEMRTEITSQSEHGRVAILFGSEKTGLSNEELSHCHWLLTIPMHEREAADRHLSMNLGQAVAVCLYEFVRDRPVKDVKDVTPLASAGDLERLSVLLAEVLQTSWYDRHHPANSRLADVRRFLLRMTIDRDGAMVWMGILRQILWKLRS